jgi:hypothetical protein
MTKHQITFLLWVTCLIVAVCAVIYLAQEVPLSDLESVN